MLVTTFKYGKVSFDNQTATNVHLEINYNNIIIFYIKNKIIIKIIIYLGCQVDVFYLWGVKVSH